MDEDKLREWGFINSWERKLREAAAEDFWCLLGATKITEAGSFESAQQSSSCRAFLSGKLLEACSESISCPIKFRRQ